MKRVLITGISGILGSNLAYCWRDQFDILGLYHSHPVSLEGVRTEAVDILDSSALERIINDFSPEIILHAAALADVDLCEKDKDLASKVNVQGTRHLIQTMKDASVPLIYISTDLVYDGVEGNFPETGKIGPKNQYALTKWQGEQLVVQEYNNSLILRTNFFGWSIAGRKSLGEWLLDELTAGRPVKGFTDAIFSSIYTFDMAIIIPAMIARQLTGIYNLGSRTFLSKHDFLVKVAMGAGLNSTLISPVSMEDVGGRAVRSKDLSMDIGKLMKDVGGVVPSFEESIEHFVNDRSKKSEFTAMKRVS